MSFKEFSKDIGEKNLKNVCILWGKEEFLTQWARDEIVKAYSNEVSRQFDVSEFDGEEADLYEITAACETLPLFSDKKLVIVDRLPQLEGKSGGTGEEALLEYLKNPAETTILVFSCGEKIDKRRSVYKAVQKSGMVYEFSRLSERELKAWIKKRIKSHGKKIGEENLKLLVELSGYYDKESEYTLFHFENDISKVILHSETVEISAEDIENTVSGNINTNVFLLIDRIGEGDKKSAFDMLNDMFLYGQSEYGIMALLYRQYENILNVIQLDREGKTRAEIVQILKSRDFIVNKWYGLARKYGEPELRRILKMLYQGDRRIKSGDMDSRMVLELIIASI